MTDWTFWAAAGAITLFVLGLIAVALASRRGAEPTAAHDVHVYRDQLQEVDRDLSRGNIGGDEAQRLRTEVARRLLDADRAAAAGAADRPAPLAATVVAVAAIAVLGLGALAVYDRIGAPGYPDVPIAERYAAADRALADRPSQAQDEAKAPPAPAPQVDPQYGELIGKLRTAVRQHPDDLKGQQLLAETEARLGNYAAAWRAQAEVVRLEGDAATAADYAWLGQLMVVAAGGHVSPEAEQPIVKALKLDPKNDIARFFAGLLYAQTGRPDRTFALWEPLLAEGGPDAPWQAPVREQIAMIARAAGIDYQPPPLPGGPSAADVAAAQGMSPAQRQEMIRGMVEGLAARLDQGGGTVEDWAKLIRAYGVLGESAKQKDALARARATFAASPADLARLEAAAAPPAAGAQALPGPDQQQVQAAQSMAPADRQAMIEGMVARLADKLATQGGTAAEWARLINAYAVLGQRDKAKAAWDKAQAAFSGQPDALAPVRAAAEKAGVAG